MRSPLAISASMLCVLAMAACALDSDPESGDNPAKMSADSSEVVTAPPELSLDGPNQQSCHVRLTSCLDSVATACYNGHCVGNEAQVQAQPLCFQSCPNFFVCFNNIVVTRC